MRAALTPRGSALALVAAAVLAASLVTGSDRREPAPAREASTARPAAPDAAAAKVARPEPAEDELDMARIVRERNAREVVDVFAPPAPPAPPPPTVEASAARAAQLAALAPPPPAPPPLPFQYLGAMVQAGSVRLFVTRGEREYTLVPGAVIEDVWRVDEVTETSAVFTYLPLGMRQSLNAPPERQ